MPKEASWHKMVKDTLKDVGKERGYDVSESEKEMVLASKFRMFRHQIRGKGREITYGDPEERKTHTFSYKPDVVWKKRRFYRAVFEIEYLNPRSIVMEKRKYAIGSWMLGYLAMVKKSVKFLVFVTNNKDLYLEIMTFKKLIPLEYKDSTHTLYLKAHDQFNITRGLREFIVGKLKI